MPSGEVISLMFEEGYWYDPARDIFAPRLTFAEDLSGVAGNHDCDGTEASWDDSYDFSSSVWSQHDSALGVADWLMGLPDDEIFIDGVSFDEPDDGSGPCVIEEEADCQFGDANLVGEHCRAILSQPLSCYAI